MKNKRFSRNIFGDLPTQKMAQKALPILVSYAQKGDPIPLGGISEGDRTGYPANQLDDGLDF